MGFLGDLLQKPAPHQASPPKNRGGRPTKAQAADKRRAALADKKLQLELKRIDRELREMDDGSRPRVLDTDTVLAVVRYLRQLGLEVRPARGGAAVDEEGLGAMLRQFAQAVGPAIGVGVARSLGAQAQAALSAQAQQLAPPVDRTAAVERQPQQSQEAEMGLVSIYLGNNLGGKSPAERAAWLLRQQDPSIQAVLAQLCALGDGQLVDYLQQVGQQVPQSAAVVAWVLGQGELWIVETVRELRRLRAGEGGAGAQGTP